MIKKVKCCISNFRYYKYIVCYVIITIIIFLKMLKKYIRFHVSFTILSIHLLVFNVVIFLLFSFTCYFFQFLFNKSAFH